MNRNQSITWGIVASLLGSMVGYFVRFPFVGLLTAFLLYWFYLKKKDVDLGYFILGYFMLAIVLTIVLFGVFGAVVVGGLWN